MHLILTTFPEAQSGNVGDLLITQSFVELARAVGAIDNYETRFRTERLDKPDVAQFLNRPVFLPGMSVSHSSYPDLYGLTERIESLPLGLIPFGCTWQHQIGNVEDAERATLSPAFHAVLSKISERTGPIATRDHMAEAILTRNGIPAVTVGDCAWYHLPSRGKPMRTTPDIRRIVVTTPHAPRLEGQSKGLVSMLKRTFPGAQFRLALHSKPTRHSSAVAAHAEEAGFEIVESAGRPEVFDEYQKFDLHVGHRLHGHIGFLRRRIPSVLLMEDARSKGFATSIPVGCFPADGSQYSGEHLADLPTNEALSMMKPNPAAVDHVETFLRQELATGFGRYVGVSAYLDTMLDKIVLPELRRKVDAASRLLL